MCCCYDVVMGLCAVVFVRDDLCAVVFGLCVIVIYFVGLRYVLLCYVWVVELCCVVLCDIV